MTTIRLKSVKIGSSIPLDKPATFFHMKKTSIWKEYIVLEGSHLEQILKKPSGSMRAYLFEFGCITFVDFEESDMQQFLEFLAGMVESIDYSMVALYAESHLLQVDEGTREFKPWETSVRTFRYDEAVIPLLTVILAKSAALNKIEADVDSNIDKSGQYLDFLKRGKLTFSKKSLTSIISEFLKFEYESIYSIRIFDRTVMDSNNLNSRELYDALDEYYELHDRFDVLQKKIGSLRNTMKTYNSLSYRYNENRLYILEIFLLGLFPIVAAIRLFW